MTELTTLLNKINETVDQKIKEVETQEQNTNEQREKYIKQIKKLSKRVGDMLLLVNTLCERKIPKSEYTYQLYHDLMEVFKVQNCPIFFANGTEKKFTNPPFDHVVLGFKKSCSYRLYVSTESIKYFAVWDSSSMSEYHLTDLEPNKFYEFIVEFERAEKIIKDFIINM